MLQTCYEWVGQPVCDAVAGALVVILLVALLIVAVAVALLLLAARQLREIDIPEDADFFETMRLIPITVPLALDMLDFVFDILAAPLAWVILEAMGLKALQLVTVTEGLIPGTQPIPTLTAAWIIARATKPSGPSKSESRVRERELAERIQRRRAERRSTQDWPDADTGAEYTEYTDR
jgi:hypothetical protein